MLLIGTFCLMQQAGAQIAAREMRIGIGSDESHPKTLAAMKFAELIKQRSGGKLVLTVYPNGKLGDDTKTTKDAQSGALDFAAPDTGTLIDMVKGFGFINFPFLFDSEQDADRLLDGPFGQKLNAGLEGAGLIGLGFWENGFRHFTNNVREIARPKDLNGLRMRSIKSPLSMDTYTALGANPMPLSYSELYAALQDKKVDGQDNPLLNIQSTKLYAVQKYMTLSRHSYSVWAFVISKKLWDKMSPQEHSIITAAAEETLAFERKAMRSSNEAVLNSLRKAGMTINELTSVERSEFRRLTRPVIDKYKNEFGKEWTQAIYMSLMQNEMKKF
jgi:tripartite ATP-independent transporter DctP family solute receptor